MGEILKDMGRGGNTHGKQEVTTSPFTPKAIAAGSAFIFFVERRFFVSVGE